MDRDSTTALAVFGGGAIFIVLLLAGITGHGPDWWVYVSRGVLILIATGFATVAITVWAVNTLPGIIAAWLMSIRPALITVTLFLVVIVISRGG